MWKSFQRGPGAHARGHTTLIAEGVTIEGSIRFSGTVEIQGEVRGEIRASSDEHAVLRILAGGHVQGDVYAPIIVVNGTVAGNVFSSEHVELAARAEVNGDVEYALIEMSKGAQITGRLMYRAERRPVEMDMEQMEQQERESAPGS